jgi:hypothetical protein
LIRRHCERSEAIHGYHVKKNGLLRAPLRKRFAFVAANDVPPAVFFALQHFSPRLSLITETLSKVTLKTAPLLTGNGLSEGFSVLVRLAYKASGGARAVPQKGTGRKYA